MGTIVSLSTQHSELSTTLKGDSPVLDANLLQGGRVWLTALSRTDAPTLARWEYDTEFLRLLDTNPARPRSEDEISRWLDTMARSRDDFVFGIRLLDTDELIGWAELDGVDWVHRTTSIGIGIGNRSYWDHGYGTEALRLLLRFAFHELNLYRIYLTVFSYNLRALRVYEKLGFQREGCYREHLERDGQRHDMLLYGLLRSEWAAD
jgi:RimJ/RimL family protein N-acetyltransferase